MRWQQLMILALLTLAFYACGFPGQPVESSGGGDGIGVKLWASTNYVRGPGETVKFRATVTNITDLMGKPRAHIVELKEQAVFDIWIQYQGTVVARWSDGKPLTRDLTYIELKPGESKTIEMDYVVSQCCDPLSGSTIFIYSQRFADDPMRAGVPVYIRYTSGH